MPTFTLQALLALSSAASAWPHFGPPGPPLHSGPPSPPPPPSSKPSSWNLKKFTSLVAFGDSYTDDSRLSYFGSHNGSAPPVGWISPANYHSADGGRPWPQYVAQYAGANIYNYAVSGAVCSNNITPRTFSAINADFPDVDGYEVPAYLADSKYSYPNGTNALNVPVDSTVYSIFIGTNDLGNYAFIDDSQVAGKVIPDYIDCVYEQFSRLYASGARYFVLQNVSPLQLSPQYGLPSKGGLNATQYWPEKPANTTEVWGRMLETVTTVNDVYKYRTPFEILINRKYPGAHFALMDMFGLITDMYNNPSEYLNGTNPTVTGYVNHCTTAGTNCVAASNPDSYLWYDPLHPSEQAERGFARAFIDVVGGNSKWATYYSA
ncbi:carbohydrate esterase family 16 protein [Aureobasidium subglaciale EXF-2481]|uniref:Carbohydrate esterase family 16 protein n=1 Tax=Aureobasidium subglaciale (strain EXF-2481) TaxID=1043005 RepID=A0A074YQ03_AURSE|nr:carbohydrate esterase family 16 protein [Aureobasidium subglaciale EXF-2481]KAI5197573.1 GDSL lipase/acylhydrolase family protein [Aureobasidium subglaciale]KAI5216456.1 GDSL lipase/acylhydrolase family protein [Aureobasidium subglaciale]KAI5219628.1 GDSL lipase/acylhydrolase family protein [Aureobasidium subglaciale]KAI5257652.1 GDSL lipase/acylhydrolase family protein [Aureobasidium subglaciale]KEQ98229.1 carbohydrate esterase family 16 protein [Aureobasidium subglaciale EXF-2481]